MTNPAAGSKYRANIQGNIVLGAAEQIRALRRLSTMALSQLFMHAKEQGSATVTINDETWTLHRHADHTFTLEHGAPHRSVV